MDPSGSPYPWLVDAFILSLDSSTLVQTCMKGGHPVLPPDPNQFSPSRAWRPSSGWHDGWLVPIRLLLPSWRSFVHRLWPSTMESMVIDSGGDRAAPVRLVATTTYSTGGHMTPSSHCIEEHKTLIPTPLPRYHHLRRRLRSKTDTRQGRFRAIKSQVTPIDVRRGTSHGAPQRDNRIGTDSTR